MPASPLAGEAGLRSRPGEGEVPPSGLPCTPLHSAKMLLPQKQTCASARSDSRGFMRTTCGNSMPKETTAVNRSFGAPEAVDLFPWVLVCSDGRAYNGIENCQF